MSSIFHRALRGLAAAVVVGLGACANYQPKPIALDAGAAAFAVRSLDAPELGARVAESVPQAPAWPPVHYDRAALLVAALAANPKLAVARAQMRAARAQEDAAAQPANPDLTLQSEYARHDPHPWLYGFFFDLDLRSSDLKRAEREFAGLGTRNAQWQWLDQVWALRRDLIAAFSDMESARRRLDLLDRLAAAQDRLIAIEEKRLAGECDAFFGYCGDARVWKVDMQAGFELTEYDKLIARWHKPLDPVHRRSLVAKAHATGPF